MQKYFFDWSMDIYRSLIAYIRFSTETQWRLVTAVSKICPKYAKGIIVMHPHHVTKWHYVTVEKKKNLSWRVNATLWMQFMTVVSLHQSHRKCTLGWQKENGSKGIIIIKCHLMASDIQMRRYFQVMCGIWRLLLVIITYPKQHELLNKRLELFFKCLHESLRVVNN